MIAPAEKLETNGHVSVTVASKRVANRLISVLENRFALALVEIQEERERILCSLWLAMAVSICLLLAGITLTAIVVVAFWGNHPIAALLVLMAFYLAGAGIFAMRLTQLHREWQVLSATIEELKKDRECLGKILS
jgi:uncharacterized membrane protein YqjE